MIPLPCLQAAEARLAAAEVAAADAAKKEREEADSVVVEVRADAAVATEKALAEQAHAPRAGTAD